MKMLQIGVTLVACAGLVAACGGGNAGGPASSTPVSGSTSTSSASAGESGDSHSPPAGSLQEQEYWVELDKELAGYAKSTNEACGTKITGAYLTPSFSGHFTYGGSYGLTPYVRASCQGLFNALHSLCGTELGKKAVAAKIQKVECRYGAKGKTDVVLNGSTLTGTIDPETGGAVMTSAATEYLRQKL